MPYTKEQKRSAYKKLPPETQDLVMSNETTELIAATLKEVGLLEEQADLADSEILHTMFCLQSLDDAINNIAKLSNKSINDLSKLKSTVQDNILSKYKINIKEFIETNKSEPEKISVPEIPPENLPMVEKGEIAHDVPHIESTPSTTLGASNQPAPAVPSQPKVPLPDYRYPGGKDPYREPLK